jgi:hypothetical protein
MKYKRNKSVSTQCTPTKIPNSKWLAALKHKFQNRPCRSPAKLWKFLKMTRVYFVYLRFVYCYFGNRTHICETALLNNKAYIIYANKTYGMAGMRNVKKQ